MIPYAPFQLIWCHFVSIQSTTRFSVIRWGFPVYSLWTKTRQRLKNSEFTKCMAQMMGCRLFGDNSQSDQSWHISHEILRNISHWNFQTLKFYSLSLYKLHLKSCLVLLMSDIPHILHKYWLTTQSNSLWYRAIFLYGTCHLCTNGEQENMATIL